MSYSCVVWPYGPKDWVVVIGLLTPTGTALEGKERKGNFVFI